MDIAEKKFAAIPYVDLSRQHAALKQELLAAMGKVLDEAGFVLGDEVGLFEKSFSQLCGVRYAVSVNSGTDALILAMRALGIGPGDEVITVPNSFVATVSAIKMVGAQPVLVDVRDDYNMDPGAIPAALTSRTRAILPVHLTGRPCDMDPILDIARKKGLFVIEDSAQAVLAEYRGRRVGSLGEIGCFSLHPLKTLNACGDGGVLTTDDRTLYERLLLMRNLGLKTREDCVVWSDNSRLDTLQAAVLMVKLGYVGAWTEGRRANAHRYREQLGDLERVRVPADCDDCKSVYHTFVIQADRRDDLCRHLAEHGIGTAVHYPVPVHRMTVGAELGYPEGSFPVAEGLAGRILSLPVYPELSVSQLERVALTIRSFYHHH